MQKPVLKFLVTGIIVFCLFPAAAQTSTYRLKVADSLFTAKKYTQSLEHYEAILKNEEYTYAMLLRMALIHEGLDQVGKALYYLNLYYEASKDPSVLRKMEELASKYGLQGYRRSDMDRLLTWYYDYHFQIAAALATVSIFLLALAFYRTKRTKSKPAGIFAALSAFLILLFVHLNFGEKISIGIIGHANVYLMAGPSPAADVMEIVSEGHRIEVIGKKDVWLKIRWDGKIAYVKENTILPVSLGG